MKIYIGPYGITDNAKLLKRGFQEMGVDTRLTYIRSGSDPFFSNKDDYDLHYTSENQTKVLMKRMAEFFYALRNYDVFIFNFCVSFFNVFELMGINSIHVQYYDLPILKALRKKIIFIVLGDDLRSRPIFVEECRKFGFEENADYLRKYWLPGNENMVRENVEKAKMVNKYADLIFAVRDCAQLLTRPYDHIWLGIDLASMRFNISSREIPLIVHAPSNRVIKGTVFIEDTVERLKVEGYEFDFVLCQNMDNEEVRELLSESSIVIDQVLAPAHGLFAIEAMAAGNVILSAATPAFNNLPDELPIITSTPKNLYDNLKEMLEDKTSWKKIMKKGRKYVEKHHDYRKTSRDMLEKIRTIV